MVKGRFDLHVLIYKEEDNYIAHCLELDMLGDGTTQEEALKTMRNLVEAQIEFHFKQGIEDKLFHPAPAEYWNKLLKAEPCNLTVEPLPDRVSMLKCAVVESNDLIPA